MPARRPFSLLMVPVLAALLVPAVFAGEGGHTLGVCAMGTRHPYFRDMLDEIEKEAARAGATIVAGDADFNLERQIAIIDGYVSRRVSMILVAPFDAAGLLPALRRARDAGIPVMTVDAAATADFPVVSHCASDNVAGGRLAAGLLLEHLAYGEGGRGGTVLVLDHAGVTSTEQRIRGFKSVMDLRGREYKVAVVDAVGQTPFAAERTAEAIRDMGTDLAGIFASNDGMTMGALEAVEKAGRDGDLVVVGYDYVEEAREAVDRGRMAGIVVQFPRRIGAAAFKIAMDYLTGRDRNPPRDTLVEVGTYTLDGFHDQRGNPIDG